VHVGVECPPALVDAPHAQHTCAVRRAHDPLLARPLHDRVPEGRIWSPFIYWQNLTWRRLRLARLGAMLREVTIDPAMLQYLDLSGSDASDPDQPPNENYARELMELFTMGPGGYSDADVKAAARALAGWSTPPPNATVDVGVDEQR